MSYQLTADEKKIHQELAIYLNDLQMLRGCAADSGIDFDKALEFLLELDERAVNTQVSFIKMTKDLLEFNFIIE